MGFIALLLDAATGVSLRHGFVGRQREMAEPVSALDDALAKGVTLGKPVDSGEDLALASHLH